MKYKEVIKLLKSQSDPKNIEGMARFGINPKTALGISVKNLRKIAKEIGYDHELALKLWESGIHEARMLAGMVDEVEKVEEKQMDSWIKDFDSWDVCDQTCANLFDKTLIAYRKAVEWSKRKPEFEKRAGYALMACLAWHDKKASDAKFIKFFPYIKRGTTDDRNYVKKAVNWALRQIGKRNKNLNKEAVKCAKSIEKIDSKSASWVAKDAIRELTNEKILQRLQ